VERKTREEAVQDLRMMRAVQSAVASLMSQEGQTFFKSDMERLSKAAGFEDAKPDTNDARANRRKLAASLKKMGAKVKHG
jgi:hypothetical protein